MIATVLQTLYVLRRYQVMGAPLQRWIVIVLLLAAPLMAVGLLPGGLAGGLIGLLLLIALLAGQRLAEGRQYVHFRAEPAGQPAPAAMPISPAEKLAVHATGLFEVEGKAQRFTAGLARWPEDETGMWYIFVKSNELRQVQPGVLGFGRSRRPALRLLVEQVLPDKSAVLDAWGLQWGKDKSKLTTRQQTIYLSFDGEAEEPGRRSQRRTQWTLAPASR